MSVNNTHLYTDLIPCYLCIEPQAAVSTQHYMTSMVPAYVSIPRREGT